MTINIEMNMHINIEKRCDASPNNSRDHNPPYKATCDSTRSPLSARHGRPTSTRRIWHVSRTKRSVSNIINSVPNGKKRWGGGHRFIPLDHPHPGRMPVRLEGKNQALLQARSSGPRAPSSGPRAGLKPPQDSSSPSPGASRGA